MNFGGMQLADEWTPAKRKRKRAAWVDDCSGTTKRAKVEGSRNCDARIIAQLLVHLLAGHKSCECALCHQSGNSFTAKLCD